MKSNWSYSPETPNLGQNQWFYVPCDLEIWWMTLKHNRAPLLCHFKHCASFMAIGEFKLELQSGNTQFRSKLAIFCPVILKFDGWPWKTIGHPFYTTSSIVHHFKAMVNSNWSYSPETLNSGQNRWFFCPLWPWNPIDDLKQGKSEGFDSCDWPSSLTQIGFKSLIFQPVWPWNLMDDLGK